GAGLRPGGRGGRGHAEPHPVALGPRVRHALPRAPRWQARGARPLPLTERNGARSSLADDLDEDAPGAVAVLWDGAKAAPQAAGRRARPTFLLSPLPGRLRASGHHSPRAPFPPRLQ